MHFRQVMHANFHAPESASGQNTAPLARMSYRRGTSPISWRSIARQTLIASITFRSLVLGQSEPYDLTANECEERAISCLANYERLSVEEKLRVLEDVRALLLIAHRIGWAETTELR